MDLLEAANHFERDQDRDVDVDPTDLADHGLQILPVDELLRDVVIAALLKTVVDGDHVLMVDGAGRPGLPMEPVENA